MLVTKRRTRTQKHVKYPQATHKKAGNGSKSFDYYLDFVVLVVLIFKFAVNLIQIEKKLKEGINLVCRSEAIYNRYKN